MRFFIMMCLLAAAHADQLGYNYQPVQHSAPAAAASYAAPSYSAPAPQTYSAPAPQTYSAPAPQTYSAPAPQTYSAPAASAAVPTFSAAPAPSYSAPAGVDKEFYSFAANDQEFLEPAASQQVDNVFNQHLRVIFIKGPEHNGLEDAAVALANSAAESKTAIYVLNKQADISELAQKLKNSAEHSHSRPEVHFVKYRTPEDAANAQHQIQSQYDALGGNSQTINGGVAPSINFASEAAAPHSEAAASAPQGNYLPASIIKRLRLV